jgi:hypothetical protein
MTLLIDIEHDKYTEPLRLMCGSDFEMLRTDATGLEIYGKSHQGKEYLLFPLHFRPLDAGVLAVRIPAEYHEWFMDRGMDGARIIFSTPHGSPFFPDMPEEYHSNTGYLRIRDASSIRVELDRLEPDLYRAARESGEPEQTSGQGQASGPENTVSAERELAEAVRAKAAELNALLGLAADAGLLVRLALEGDGNGRPCLCIRGIFRPL